MRKPGEIPTFPLAGWDIGLIQSEGRVLFRALYLASPADGEVYAALMHSMAPDEARELAGDLIRQAVAAEDK